MAKYDVTEQDGELQISTHNDFNGSLSRADDTHVLAAYRDVGPVLKVGILTVNDITWAVTEEATLTLDGAAGDFPLLVKIDSTHFLVIWQGPGSDGFAQIVTVNTSTWAVTSEGAALEFDTTSYSGGSACLIDSQNVLLFYVGAASDGFAVMLQVNLGTWAVTKPGSALEFEPLEMQLSSSSCAVIDSTHVIHFWADDASDGIVRVFSVDTGTGTITAEDSEFEFDTTNGTYNSCFMIDANHFINFWEGASTDGFTQVFTVNLGTWAVTKEGTALEFDTTSGLWNSCHEIDSNHFINMWQGTSADGFAQSFEVDLGTWAVTANGSALEFKDASTITFTDIVLIDDFGNYLIMWQDNNNTGRAEVLNVEGIVPKPKGGFSGSMIKNWIFMRVAWGKNKIWTPKIALPKWI